MIEELWGMLEIGAKIRLGLDQSTSEWIYDKLSCTTWRSQVLSNESVTFLVDGEWGENSGKMIGLDRTLVGHEVM